MTATDAAVEIDALRGWIGRTETRTEDLTPALAERFNATFGLSDPIETGDAAPLLIHLCLTQPVVPAGALGPDGHPARGGFLPPVPLPRRMWAGGAFTFHRPLRIGTRVTRQSTISDVVLKQGRSGPLCFVTVTHEMSDPNGLAVSERQDIVYRGHDQGRPAPDPAAADPGPHHRQFTADPVLLFRYSALTFNGHRIHYDQPYASREEGYPGLVVHGPLQATLLAQYAADLRSAPPKTFRFRSLTPLFDTADVTLNARDDAEGLTLWTARPNGPIAMEATATW
ncbi:MaoC family dehydratase N-terminal domain-containing protein [Pseudoruegeria sp. SK021]|uniref:FAS1-like dehydratase domain-containing protein n=1 Tax=Pseudoruegeria sp. SK021 TaxID=1933035 RepID=UPI000A217D28|nr:MaoC family dehydratase N-terminal domain-containing protein [Pseudoruegeria sp. SK021]OSP54209.1 protein dehydratase [Pseudoruegeria sp. SK021]